MPSTGSKGECYLPSGVGAPGRRVGSRHPPGVPGGRAAPSTGSAGEWNLPSEDGASNRREGTRATGPCPPTLVVAKGPNAGSLQAGPPAGSTRGLSLLLPRSGPLLETGDGLSKHIIYKARIASMHLRGEDPSGSTSLQEYGGNGDAVLEGLGPS